MRPGASDLAFSSSAKTRCEAAACAECLAVSLFQLFVQNVAPMVRIFHMPTLIDVHHTSIASRSTDKSFEALRAAIYYSAVVSISTEQCMTILAIPRDVAIAIFRSAVKRALSREGLLNTQNFTVLQAVVLYLTVVDSHEDSRSLWSLTSLVYHVARSKGLHRDGSFFGLRPFDTELRRRLWWHICVLDARSAEYHYYDPIVDEAAFDTRPPLHINDRDLEQNMAEPPKGRWGRFTDSTFAVVRCDAVKTGWKLRRSRNQLGGVANVQLPSTLEERELLVDELQHLVHNKFLRNEDSVSAHGVVVSTATRLIAARLSLAIHSMQARDRTSSSKLFDLAVDILEASILFLTKESTLSWAWYSKTNFHWGALFLVLNELCSSPLDPRCDRAWAMVTIIERELKIYENATKGVLYWHVSKLITKAQCARPKSNDGS